MDCPLCDEKIERGHSRVTVEEPGGLFSGRKEICHTWCFNRAYAESGWSTPRLFVEIDAHRKAKENPCIGQTCARCGEQIKTSEMWWYVKNYQGVFGSARHSGYIFFHKKCPEE